MKNIASLGAPFASRLEGIDDSMLDEASIIRLMRRPGIRRLSSRVSAVFGSARASAKNGMPASARMSAPCRQMATAPRPYPINQRRERQPAASAASGASALAAATRIQPRPTSTHGGEPRRGLGREKQLLQAERCALRRSASPAASRSSFSAPTPVVSSPRWRPRSESTGFRQPGVS